MIVRNQIDCDTIPLLKKINGENLHPRSIGLSIKQRFDKELVLRVQTEVVLSILRKDLDEGEKDWVFYESELERAFEEAKEDNRLLDCKSELRALLESKNQTKDTVTAYFRKFSLNKLRLDLRSFIDEKREALDTMFLDQLSRAFLDANGKPFSEDLGGVEKTTNVETNEKLQDHVGSVKCVESLQELEERDYQYNLEQNPKVSVTEDQHDMVPGTSMVSGKKRRRWELLSTQTAIGDDGLEEADDEGLAGPLLRQCVSEPAVRTSGPQLSCFLGKKEVESTEERSLLKRGGERPLSGASNLGQDVMRSSRAHESTDMEEEKIRQRGPSRRNKLYFTSDSETQVAQRLSTDGKDRLIEKDNCDNHNKRGSQSFSENGFDRGLPQGNVQTEVMKETIILRRGKKILMDRRRKEASTGSPEEDNKRLVTNNEFKTLDAQDVYEVDFLEVGCDGDEEVCHMCGKHGKLLRCEGCLMSMHLYCIKALGLRLPKSEEWRCPDCLLLMAEREAAEAEKVRVVITGELGSSDVPDGRSGPTGQL